MHYILILSYFKLYDSFKKFRNILFPSYYHIKLVRIFKYVNLLFFYDTYKEQN